MIATKSGVKFNELEPAAKLAAYKVRDIYEEYDYSLVITSTNTDSQKHKNGSLHYLGLAFDCRTRDINKTHINSVIRDIKKRLNTLDKRYQVVVHETHIHIEFDRRIK